MTTLTRPHQTLDGSWQFRTDPHSELESDSPGAWQSIDVPGPWQAQHDDLRFYQGVAWYRRDAEIPLAWEGRSIYLCFGAVDYLAEVWVNGQPIGDHEGGYLPFEFEISAALQFGAMNTILVRVTDPDDDSAQWATPGGEIPHGKQNWYGPLSGLWQSVRLEARPTIHLATLQITPNARTGEVLIDVAVAGPQPSGELTITLLDPDGRLVGDLRHTITEHQTRLTSTVANVVRWDIENPARYSARATLQSEAGIDLLTTRFGFRSFESRDGSLWLNDRPLMLRGALDQDYYPDGISTPPSYEFLLRQAELAKRMGLNCLRCHIKIADPRYLEAADEAGLLIWAELPNWTHWTPEGGERGVATLSEAINRDWNHPSVVIWSIINESWGIDQSNPEHRAWLLSAFDQIKAIAGDRLVVDNSACFNNYHLKSDLDDYHFYAAMPDERARWREWIQQFAQRPKWSYGAELPQIQNATERWLLGDAGYGAALPEVERSGQEPLIVSEFGNWGLPSLAALRGASGRDPWWFETGDDWGDGVVYPHGIERRFERLGLAQIFGDYERFAASTRRAELDALRFEIEELRRHPTISGYIITEFTDVHWECNGLLDMRRNPKLPLATFAALNADTVLIIDREQHALWSAEDRSLPIAVSHWGVHVLEGGEIRWELVRREQIIRSGQYTFTQPIAPRTTVDVGVIEYSAPAVANPERLELWITLWSGGQAIASTTLTVAVYPQPISERPMLYVHGSPDLQTILEQLGYPLSEEPGDYPTVTTQFDELLRARVLDGEHVIMLAETPDAIAAPIGPLALRQRAGTPWQGSWASSFAWMAGDWPGDRILDEQFAHVLPHQIITGIAQQSFGRCVGAGLCVGWIQKPVAITATWQLGRGSVTVTTFRLSHALGNDPVADMIFEQLIGAEVA